jgi:hypothetical protein
LDRNAQSRDRAGGERQGHLLAKPAELVQLRCPGRLFHGPSAEEQTGFVYRIVQHVEHAAGDADRRQGRDAEKHVADLTDRAVGEQLPEIVLD